MDPLFHHPSLHSHNDSDISIVSSVSSSSADVSAAASRSQRLVNPAWNASADFYYQEDDWLTGHHTSEARQYHYPERLLARSHSDASNSQVTYTSSSSGGVDRQRNTGSSSIARAPPASPNNYAPRHLYENPSYGSPSRIDTPLSQLQHTTDVMIGMGFRPFRRPISPRRPLIPQDYHPSLPMPAQSLPQQLLHGAPMDDSDRWNEGSSIDGAIGAAGHETTHSAVVRDTTQICQPGGILGYLGGLFWNARREHALSAVLAQDGPVETEMRCPICAEIMRDPVIDRDGYTYERKAILQWLEHDNRSPLTRKPLSEADLRPNRALKSVIQQYLLQKKAET
jgi:hypothetical protein